MEYDKLDLRFPWRFFQGKNIITADSILYCTRNLERNITKDYSKEKASWQKDKEKILGLQIKWKKNLASPKIKHASTNISLPTGKNKALTNPC